MSWLQQQVSFYTSHSDNVGRPATYRDIILCESLKDISIINRLRRLDKEDPAYKTKKLELKGSLQCFTPAALLETKKKGMVKVINRTGVMQLDFDYNDIHEFDIEELKQAVFSLPFICFCGTSCSGDGFYALGLIAEPEKLSDYAEHCFEILLTYGIKADTSKGKKVENLRYVSYDSKMLIREDPKPLYVKHFKAKPKPVESTNYKANIDLTNVRLVEGIKRLQSARVGNRWETVQKVAYTLGGLGNPGVISEIRQVIKNTAAFEGEDDKYCKCAEVCFAEGLKNPYRDLVHQ